MTAAVHLSLIASFSKEQLEAVERILKLLDPEEFRDYHGQFGVCNAPDVVEILRNEVRSALGRFQKDKSLESYASAFEI